MGSPSEDLRRYSGATDDNETAKAIHDAFLASARVFAERQLNVGLRHRVTVSEVVNSAMRSALSDVQHERFNVLNSSTFHAHLLTILQRKVASAVRQAKAEKRSVEKEVIANPTLLTDGRELTPVAKAVVDEVAALAATELLKSTGESIPMRAYVTALGVLFGCPPGAIQEALRSSFPDEKVPALRSIQLQIQSGRKTLEAKLQEIGDETDV